MEATMDIVYIHGTDTEHRELLLANADTLSNEEFKNIFALFF